MFGGRSIFLGLALALVATIFTPQQVPPLLFQWVDAGNGLKVMRYEVSIAQWQTCVVEGGCSYLPKSAASAADPNYPITGIGILDAQEFVKWAQKRTKQAVQLPTLVQWNDFSEIPPSTDVKRFVDPRLQWAATYGAQAKVDSILRHAGGFGQTSKNIADVKGNVWEWTSSCVVDAAPNKCPAYFSAGEHEAKIPIFVRDTASGGCGMGIPPAHLGMRLVLNETN